MVVEVGRSVLFCPSGVQLAPPLTPDVFHKKCVITAFVVMGPVGGLVSERGPKPGTLRTAGTTGCPPPAPNVIPPPPSQWSFRHGMNMMPLAFVVLRVLNSGFAWSCEDKETRTSERLEESKNDNWIHRICE